MTRPIHEYVFAKKCKKNIFIHLYSFFPMWLRGIVVERRSLTGERPCPALDLHLTGDHLRG